MQPCRVELSEANQFVSKLHRHHKPVTGHRFSIGVSHGGQLVGVAICGRPVSRLTDQKNTLEVLRVCTNGTKNACSYLYAACYRVARELGFKSIQTFILASEPGTSLQAAGWAIAGYSDGGNWNTPARGGRKISQPMGRKVKYARLID